MYLSSYEEKIANGEFGVAKQLAISLLIDIGEFFEAEKFIEITSAHLSGVSYLTGGEGLLDQLKSFVDIKAKVCIHTTLNPCGMDLEKPQKVGKKFAAKQLEIINLYKQLGVAATCTCTPYEIGNIARFGEHLAWAESSAGAFANAYFGARTNPENISALAAAIIGKVPLYGFHIKMHRLPNVVVDVNASLNSETDFSLLGYLTAYQCSDLESQFQFGAVPFFKGIKKADHITIKNLAAGLATHGIHMFHIEGITPEWKYYRGRSITERISIKDADLKNFYTKFNGSEADLIITGCPHASLQEVAKIAHFLKNRKLKRAKLWIFTSRATMAVIRNTSILKNILSAGAEIICDTCPVVMPLKKIKSVISTSAKAMHYISAPTLNNIPASLLPVEKCIELCTT